MRFLLFASLLIGCSIVPSCNSRNAVQVSDEDIAEAVFRFQIERCYESNPPKVYFLSFMRKDPTGDFMARFRANNPVVRKHSQMSGEYTDLESGKRGIVLSVEKLNRISATEFQVEGACVAGGRNGNGFVYSVMRERGEWKVKGSRETWIS